MEPEESPKSKSFPEELQRRMWITRGVRFVSAERLKKKHLLSIFGINILSLCVIGFEIISILDKTKTHTMELLLPIATILAPVFIIVMAAHENSKRYLVYAERMHSSAQLISKLYSELEYKNHTKTLKDDDLNKLRIDYEAALDALTNHDDVDYKYFQSLHPKPFIEENNSTYRYFILHLRGRIPYYFDVWFIPITVTVIPVGTFLYALWTLIDMS